MINSRDINTVASIVGQLIFEDIKFWGFSKHALNKIFCENIVEDEAVEIYGRSYNFADKYFWGSVIIHNILDILYHQKL